MPVASIVFLTPTGGSRRARRCCCPSRRSSSPSGGSPPCGALLTLSAAEAGVDVAALAALVAVVAAARARRCAAGARRTRDSQRVRTDAEALFVLDISQSMAASSGAEGQDAARARHRGGRPPARGRAVGAFRSRDAHGPRAAEPAAGRRRGGVRRDAAAAPWRSTSRRRASRTCERRPSARSPASPAPATSSGSAKRRAIVLLTDGETAPYDANTVAKALGGNPRTNLLAVQFWRRQRVDLQAVGTSRIRTTGRILRAGATRLTRERDPRHASSSEGDLGSAAASLKLDAGQRPDAGGRAHADDASPRALRRRARPRAAGARSSANRRPRTVSRRTRGLARPRSTSGEGALHAARPHGPRRCTCRRSCPS